MKTKTKTKMAFKVWTIYVEHLISYCHFYNIHKKVLTKIHFKNGAQSTAL